ncbi:hypothetical protein ACIBCB_21295 [Streptomyces uncialis]|uniref:DUF7691 family protein n=1 Tax=Streptomyces uncialis TaxID=1048205 RepID=UPI0037BE1F25
MSHNISYSTADKADVLAFLGSSGTGLDTDRKRRLPGMLEAALAHQESLDDQGVDWGLSVPVALSHLFAGRMDSDAPYAGNAYTAALQHIIDFNASDPSGLGTYSAPSTFFGLVDDELSRLGVRADLLPRRFLFGGPGEEFPVLHSVDGYPAIGHLPLARTKAAADAYRAVLDRIDPDLQLDVTQLIEALEFEHREWERATANVAWYTQDTLFFSLV